jgi:hypothetical protein
MLKRKLVSSFSPSNLFLSISRASQSPESRTTMSFFRSKYTTTPSASLIAFYEGSGVDHRGRKIGEILGWGVHRLESSHDYIQTLFPLPEESGVNWSAPVIDQEVFDAFRSRPELGGKLRESFERILWFYGFDFKTDHGKVVVSRHCA